jgi:hypothetical protein
MPAAPPARGERNNVTIDVSPDMLRKQLTIIGSWTFLWQGQADCARFAVELQGRCREAVHVAVEPRSGRRSLSPVRYPDGKDVFPI